MDGCFTPERGHNLAWALTGIYSQKRKPDRVEEKGGHDLFPKDGEESCPLCSESLRSIMSPNYRRCEGMSSDGMPENFNSLHEQEEILRSKALELIAANRDLALGVIDV